jgi:hypothetical protein
MLVENNESNINNNSKLNITSTNTNPNPPPPPNHPPNTTIATPTRIVTKTSSPEEISSVKQKLLDAETNFISLQNNNNTNNINTNSSSSTAPATLSYLPFPETVYLEMLTETMFQNGQTTVNQLEEILIELNRIMKQCFIVANVCKQKDLPTTSSTTSSTSGTSPKM